jgi:hypothetical protein
MASPVLASGGRTASTTNKSPAVTAPAAVAAPAPVAGKPVLTARVPFTTVWNSTLLSANSQAMGLQVSRGANNHVRWTIVGAAVGAIVGAIADDPLRDAAIGAAVGFGGSYVMRR